MGILHRKSQERQGSASKIQFPKPGSHKDWSNIVRFVRIGKNPAPQSEFDQWHLTYKYIQHKFDKMPGQGPVVMNDGTVVERNALQFAYCLGSPSNPYTQEQNVPVNEQGCEECRSIVLPNGMPLHDIDQGGELFERCIVWSWTNNHMAIIDRKTRAFFDPFAEWCQAQGVDPFFYNEANPGFDIILTTPSRGGAYTYSFGVPLGGNKDITTVKPLMQAQLEDIKKDLVKHVRTKEEIIEALGIGAGKPAPGAASNDDDDFGSGVTPGSVGRMDDSDDSLGEDL